MLFLCLNFYFLFCFEEPKQNTIDGESNLLMVLLAVTLPRLTRYDSSLYRPDLQGNKNNSKEK